MSEKPVNLNQFRKAKRRDEKKTRGDANAAKFGRSKADRDLQEARSKKMRVRLDSHRRDT